MKKKVKVEKYDFKYYLENMDFNLFKYWYDPRTNNQWSVGDVNAEHDIELLYELFDEDFDLDDEDNLSKDVINKALNNNFARISISKDEFNIQTRNAKYFKKIQQAWRDEIIEQNNKNIIIIWEIDLGTYKFTLNDFLNAQNIRDNSIKIL